MNGTELWINNWNNGHERTLKAGDTDPDDPRLKLLKVGDIIPRANIDGKGIVTVAGSSPRLYITQKNQNIRFSADVMVTGSVKECYLVVRSNHEDRPGGFGGYYGYFNFKEEKMYFKKELTHEKGYSPRLNETPIDFTANTWHHIVIAVKNVASTNVSLNAQFDGKEVWGLDDGTITCGNEQNTAPYRSTAKWCFIRTNEPSGVQYRNAKLESI